MTFEVFGLTEGPATLGLGWETAIGAFDLSSYADRRDRLFPEAREVVSSGGGCIRSLFAGDADQFFRAWKVEASGSITLPIPSFAILVVLEGHGTIASEGGRIDVRQGETLVAPWSCGQLTVNGDVSLIACLPPES